MSILPLLPQVADEVDVILLVRLNKLFLLVCVGVVWVGVGVAGTSGENSPVDVRQINSVESLEHDSNGLTAN